MLQTSGGILTLMFILAYTESFSVNKTAELISTYAKVAHWGTATSKPVNEGRSSGQTLWTHRSDVNIRGGQNLKRKQPVTYYYSMQAPSSKVDQAKEEPIPSKGEVQERFNPRPYFDFVFDDPPRSNQQPDTFKPSVKQSGSSVSKPKPPAIVYGTPVDSFPGFDKPPSLPQPSVSDSKPPADSYSSPFSSYNPPGGGSKNKAPDSFDFPPNNNQPPPLPPDLYGPPNGNQPPAPPALYGPPSDSKPPKPPAVSYEPPNAAPPPPDSYNAPPPDVYGPPKDTYGPPNSMPKPPKEFNKPQNNMKPPPDYSFHPPLAGPPQGSMPPKQPDHSYMGPPPPDGDGDSDSSYYAPPPPAAGNGHGDHSHPPPDGFHHAPHGGGMDSGNDDGPPISQTVEPSGPVEQPYFDHPPTNHDHPPHAPSMAEGDLSPPPAAAAYGKIPQYLDHQPNDHDFYHFGHHDHHEVYHEVQHPTTTTTEAPRAGHYSYYYLGRKLWYIPLYFSVYFIVYVTVLILKSIARHKIQFSHNFDKGRDSRELDINSINQTVIDAIENVQNKYM